MDPKLIEEQPPTAGPEDRRPEAVVNQQKNDDPDKQEQLTGESITAPEDTMGG